MKKKLYQLKYGDVFDADVGHISGRMVFMGFGEFVYVRAKICATQVIIFLSAFLEVDIVGDPYYDDPTHGKDRNS